MLHTKTRRPRPKITYTKKVAGERYDIRAEHAPWLWAMIFLDEETGCVNIQSDYGDYSYQWLRHGRPSLKHFLADLDDDYLSVKFGKGDKVFYKEETFRLLRKDAREICTKEQRAEVFEEIGHLESCDTQSTNDYYSQLMHGDYPALAKLFETCAPCREGPPLELVLFVKHVWGPFRKILRKELKAFCSVAEKKSNKEGTDRQKNG